MTVDSVFLKFSHDILQGAHALHSLCNNNPVMKQLTNQHIVHLRNIMKGQANMMRYDYDMWNVVYPNVRKNFTLCSVQNSIVEYKEIDSV